jgi:predicted acetyltransferase
MDLQVRPLALEELGDFVRAQELTFGVHAHDEDASVEALIFEPERSLAVFDGDRIVGGTMACTMQMTVPGGAAVATAGVTSVGVQPTHRRRGLLTGLMREQLEDVRERGEPLAALWASEAGIYGRFGYGVAAPILDVKLPREHAAFAVPVEPAEGLRLIDAEEALRVYPGVYDRVRPERPGMMARNKRWWKYRTTDLEHHREGATPYFFVVLEGADGPEGYVFYRLRHDWQQHLPAAVLEVDELVAVTPRAEAQLWRYCLSVDLIASIRAVFRPADEPLKLLLADPRRLHAELLDGLYVRTVDVAGALAARRYRTEGRLVLEVRDPFCEWNDGRYALDGGPEGATCERTEDEPDVRLDATALGAAYLGGVGFGALHRALRAEGSPEALARADAMFGSNVAPWCPHIF